jgi:hypothetical protein
MQKASRHPAHSTVVRMEFEISNLKFEIPFSRRPNGRGSDTLYAWGCRYYFTPLAGVLFTFPSRYLFTIGCQGVFSLIRWSGRIHAEFHVHRITWDAPRGTTRFADPALTVYGRLFQIVQLACHPPTSRSLNPGSTSTPGLGSSAFARHY